MPTTLKPVSPFCDDNPHLSNQPDFGTVHCSSALLADEVLLPASLDDNLTPRTIPDTKFGDFCSPRSTPAPEFRVVSRATKSPHRQQSPYTTRKVAFRHTTPVKANSSSDESSELSSSEDESIASTLSEGSKIPKPQGEPGRPGRGGYNLQTALEWDPKTYSKFKKFIYRVIDEHLDVAKCISSQNHALLKVVCNKGAATFPDLENYEKQWPVTDMIMLRLKYTSSRARKRETEVVAEKAKAKRTKSMK